MKISISILHMVKKKYCRKVGKKRVGEERHLLIALVKTKNQSHFFSFIMTWKTNSYKRNNLHKRAFANPVSSLHII